jgi:hypothetical protein
MVCGCDIARPPSDEALQNSIPARGMPRSDKRNAIFRVAECSDFSVANFTDEQAKSNGK